MTEQVLTGVGAELQRAREAAGLAVNDVAQRLKLLPRQVESLEHERFERLPGPAIARGMVRNYARLLKLDPEPLLERMAPRAENAPHQRPIAGRHREQLPSSAPGRRSTLLYVGFSVGLLVVIGAFAYQWQRESAAPQSAAPVVVAPVAPPRSEPLPAAEQKPAEKPVAAIEKPVAEPEARSEAPAPKPRPQAPAQAALPAGGHRLVLRMEEDAWLEVRDGTGRSLVSSLNAAGTERAVRGQPPFELVVGNAANVKLTYDGKPVDLKPYTRGAVARLTLK